MIFAGLLGSDIESAEKTHLSMNVPDVTWQGGLRIMRDYYTVTELANEFRVNPKTIYRRLWARQIPAYKVGRSWRIAKKDIKWLRQ
jgi:excisionase family DNA binding protein